ncbi:MAG: Uma2 family endonuclease [Isosphaeraceae bacterium]
MATTASLIERGPEPGPELYRLTASQVAKMVETGILPGSESVELLDGVLWTMTKGELHNAIVDVLGELLRARMPPGYRVREEESTSADDYSLPEPDLAIFLGGPFDFLPDPAPIGKAALVIEVNLNSPWDHDRKRAMYAQAGVASYWVVDVASRQVVVYRDPAGSTFDAHATFRGGDAIPLSIDGQLLDSIEVDAVFPPLSKPDAH